MEAYGACASLNLSLQRPIDEGCDVFLPHSIENFASALLVALASNYLLQFIYYKVLLYIVFGKRTGTPVI